LKLQYIDSQLAESVLKHFTSRDIPCLCVHDSFIVPKKYGDELEGVMKDTYKSKINYDIKVK